MCVCVCVCVCVHGTCKLALKSTQHVVSNNCSMRAQFSSFVTLNVLGKAKKTNKQTITEEVGHRNQSQAQNTMLSAKELKLQRQY
jgi:hypothetical protein